MKFFFRITDIQQVRDRFDFYDNSTTASPLPTSPPTKDLIKPPSESETKVKKSKSVRFHSDVMKAPVATSTSIKIKSDKSDKPDKIDKLNNGVINVRAFTPMPTLAKDAAIDVNCDEWLKKQVKLAKELKKSKSKEVKNAIKDIKETIRWLV